MTREQDRIQEIYKSYRNSHSSNQAWASNKGKEWCWEKLLALWSEHILSALPVKEVSVLELGCSSGGVLKRLERLFTHATFHGVDIREEPIKQGLKSRPDFKLMQADVSNLPYEDGTFDITFQSVCFSSIIDDELRLQAAREQVRVTRDSGYFVSWDMRMPSPNPNVVSLRKKELKRLYEGYHIELISTVLLPPLHRRINAEWLLEALAFFPFLRSHYFCYGRKTSVS